MKRVEMVPTMARPELDEIVPPEEAENPQEQLVQEPSTKDRPVAELVETIQEERVESPVEENDKYGDRYRQTPDRKIRR